MRRISPGQRLAGLLSLALLAIVAVPAPALAQGFIPPRGNVAAFPTYGGVPVACADDTSYAMGDFGLSDRGYEFTVADTGPTITQWQYLAGSRTGTVALQILSEQHANGVFAPIAESAVETPTPSSLNTFNTRIALPPGEYSLAIKSVSGGPECFSTGFPYYTVVQKSPSPPVGSGTTLYGSGQDGARINVATFGEYDKDLDGFLDISEDGCPGNTQRHDDCVKPDLPNFESSFPRRGKITFTFSGFEPGTFECHLQDKKFAPCTSPVKLKHLEPGHYNFTVRSVDAAGNIGPQTSSTFRIGPPPFPHH
jgi:hypothetical protein